MDIRSVAAGGSHQAGEITTEYLPEILQRYPLKFYWFVQHGYRPHIWQALFHGATYDSVLARFRHLAAGRRGGKTLSAAWEVLYYATHPRAFHWDAHGEESDKPLWIWCLAKDYKIGRPSLITFLQVIRQAGLVKNVDYTWNKTESVFEFLGPDGDPISMVEFRTAVDPQSLRGAGLDILWIDEAALVPDDEAWIVVAPSLADNAGLVITTTTPFGKNWFFREFFDGPALEDEWQFRVQYTSIDNPHFKRSEWEYWKKRFHPIMFRQEFMAAFDAMTGIALMGDWLHFWVSGNPDIRTDDIGLKRYRNEDGTYNLDTYIGVDPALSLSEKADHFAMAVIGVTKDGTQAFLLDYIVTRVQFPDQLDLIRTWHLKWRPRYIGIESVAFQAALSQAAMRMPGLPPILPIMSKGKKNDRILAMSPLFKIGRIRVNARHHEFIDQWVSFDPEKKNQEDDLLDAVEIAVGTVGVLLPTNPHEAHLAKYEGDDLLSRTAADLVAAWRAAEDDHYDPELGADT